jgi:hypothetical protein
MCRIIFSTQFSFKFFYLDNICLNFVVMAQALKSKNKVKKDRSAIISF